MNKVRHFFNAPIFGRFAKYGGLAVFYLAFITSAAIFTKNRTKYSGVQSWPSVPATITGSSSSSYTVRTEQRFHGSGTNTFGVDEVAFEYEVDGVTYVGDTASPNGGPLPLVSIIAGMGAPERKAYYKPDDPSIAVLDPSPYHGNAAMIVFGGLSAIVVVVHLLSELLPRLKRIGKPTNT